MQTLIYNNQLDKIQYPVEIFYSDNEIAKEIRIVDFMKKTEVGESIITLCSHMFLKNKIKVTIRNKKLILVISENVTTHKSVWMPINDWEHYTPQTYVRMHNLGILLPGDNFYIVRHFLVPDKLLFRVVLGQQIND